MFYGCTKCCKDYPADVFHCWRCQRCVDEYSHHCTWLNNCIGRRNYRWYVSMLTCAMCNQLLFLAAAALASKQTIFEGDSARLIVTWIEMVICTVVACLFIHLLVMVVISAIKRRPACSLFEKKNARVYNTSQAKELSVDAANNRKRLGSLDTELEAPSPTLPKIRTRPRVKLAPIDNDSRGSTMPTEDRSIASEKKSTIAPPLEPIS
jgi:hypothetical protein